MNVKIDGEGLRFRLSEDELKTLLNGGTLQETLRIGRRTLGIAVDSVGASDDLIAVYDENTIRLLVSPDKVRELSSMGRSREGLEQTAHGLTVSLQVDFRTQKRPKT